MRILLRAANSPFEKTDPGLSRKPGRGNSGNLLFAHSVYRSLFAPGNVIDADELRPDFASPEQVNETYDAFALPFANAFRQAFEPQLKGYTDLISKLKIPCIVVGIGAQAGLDLAELRGSAMDAAVRAFVSAVLDRSASIGVRGEVTRDYLSRLGFRDVDVIGCPSLHASGGDVAIQKRAAELALEDQIAVNHTQSARSEIAHFIRRVMGQYKASVFVAQEAAQREVWFRWLNENPGLGPATERLRHFADVPPWLAYLTGRAFSVGTRIHGSIAAILAGTPAMVIAHDSRTFELARYHGIPYRIDADIDVTTRVEDLFEEADFGLFNSSSIGHFTRYKDFLEKNGLPHSFDDPQNAFHFDARVQRAFAAETRNY